MVLSKMEIAAQRAVETHKHELSQQAAFAAFEYQRRLTDFNLFVAKRHDTIARLHTLLLDAMSRAALLLESEQYVAVLDNVSIDDIAEYLAEEKFSKRRSDEILALWNSDQSKARDLIERERYRKRASTRP